MRDHASSIADPAERRVRQESLRTDSAWAAHGGLICSLNTGTWPQDQAAVAWGILLSDIARHAADALHQTHGLERAAVLATVRGVFDSELDGPTAPTTGKFA